MGQRGIGGQTLVTARIYLEGGGDSKAGKIACQKGFRTLLEKCGLTGRMPRLIACGSRNSAYDDFRDAHASGGPADYIALLVDSEYPVADLNATWRHLRQRDGWTRPPGADDEQVLLMTTCMETWLVADRDTLAAHYGSCLQPSALPPTDNLESRRRDDIQRRLERATRSCAAPYAKGPPSFAILGRLNPNTLAALLPSFRRARQILDARL